MSTNFLATNCKEPSRNIDIFGICDDQKGSKAYTDITDQNKWIATVKNDNNIVISFTAIDNCLFILKPGTKDHESTCDGMLLFTNSIYLIELKKQKIGGWLSSASMQLANTAKLILENHDLKEFRYKKAFACNKKHPNFTVIEAESRKSFYRRTNGFRIDAQTEIVIR